MEKGAPDEVLERLKSFPYYRNYEELAWLELCSILSVTKQAPKKIAFIGSGPLPLTSLCLLDALRRESQGKILTRLERDDAKPVVLNVDCDEVAIAASRHLCLALGDYGQGMEFICADASSSTQNLHDCDVVYVAALVGMSQTEKEDIITRVATHMRKGALMVVRSSWGLRTCLYPEFDIATEKLLQLLEPCVAVHPYGQVVNSVIVARVRGNP
jgi:nicotianamine synthase